MKYPIIRFAFLVVCLIISPAAWAGQALNQSATMQAPKNGEVPAPSQGAIPHLVKFSGTLLDAQDRPVVGPVGVTFAIYAQQTEGAALWLETQNVKPDGHGSYSVLLGAESANGLPPELFAAGESRWLGVQAERQVEQPRVLLVSVPYALKAGDAQTLGGKPASAFVTTESLAGTTSNTAAAATSPNAPSTIVSPALSSTLTAVGVKKAASPQQPAAACAAVTSDGTAATNSLSLFTAPCTIQSSLMTQAVINGFLGVNLAGNNTGLLLNGTGTHEITVTGSTSSGRLGQDSQGFFFASDTNGKAIKFDTNNGALNEWMRITGTGNVGIHTQTPVAPLDVNGNFHSSGTVTGTQLVSTIATGTAPLSVASTTVVPNLSASLLGGLPPAAFAMTAAPNVFTADQIISTSDSTAAPALSVSQSGTGSGAALFVTQGDTGGGAGVIVAETGTGPAISATTNGSGPALTVTSSGSGPALLATETGTGDALDVQVTAGHALRVDNLGNVIVGGPFVAKISNDTVTGTTANSVAKLTCGTGSCLAIKTATSDVGGAVGVVVSGAGTTGKALVALFGVVSCNFDGSVTAGDYVQLSSTVAGDCHDAGATYPTSGQVLGRVIQTAVGAGLYQMFQIVPEIRGF